MDKYEIFKVENKINSRNYNIAISDIDSESHVIIGDNKRIVFCIRLSDIRDYNKFIVNYQRKMRSYEMNYSVKDQNNMKYLSYIILNLFDIRSFIDKNKLDIDNYYDLLTIVDNIIEFIDIGIDIFPDDFYLKYYKDKILRPIILRYLIFLRLFL